MTFPFLKLPPEIRIQVYALLLEDRCPYGKLPADKSTVSVRMLDCFDTDFLCISKQVSKELMQVTKSRMRMVLEVKLAIEYSVPGWLACMLNSPNRPVAPFAYLRFLTIRLRYTTEASVLGICFCIQRYLLVN